MEFIFDYDGLGRVLSMFLYMPIAVLIDMLVCVHKETKCYNADLSFLIYNNVIEEVKLGVDFLNIESRYVFIWWVVLLSIFTLFLLSGLFINNSRSISLYSNKVGIVLIMSFIYLFIDIIKGVASNISYDFMAINVYTLLSLFVYILIVLSFYLIIINIKFRFEDIEYILYLSSLIISWFWFLYGKDINFLQIFVILEIQSIAVLGLFGINQLKESHSMQLSRSSVLLQYFFVGCIGTAILLFGFSLVYFSLGKIGLEDLFLRGFYDNINISNLLVDVNSVSDLFLPLGLLFIITGLS